MIYEGTNGIQAMDLLGRKLGLKKGQAIMDLMTEMQKTIKAGKDIEAVAPYAEELEKALNKLGEVAMHLGGKAMSEEVLQAFAHAYSFLEVSGDVAMAWMLLWRANVAAQNLDKAKKKDKPFYEGQIKSCQFFVENILPTTMGKMKSIHKMGGAAVEISEDAFGGK
jgi:hypothetical protein